MWPNSFWFHLEKMHTCSIFSYRTRIHIFQYSANAQANDMIFAFDSSHFSWFCRSSFTSFELVFFVPYNIVRCSRHLYSHPFCHLPNELSPFWMSYVIFAHIDYIYYIAIRFEISHIFAIAKGNGGQATRKHSAFLLIWLYRNHISKLDYINHTRVWTMF